MAGVFFVKTIKRIKKLYNSITFMLKLKRVLLLWESDKIKIERYK